MANGVIVADIINKVVKNDKHCDIFDCKAIFF